MRHTLLFHFILLLTCLDAVGQTQTVDLDKKYYQFNNGGKLPAQSVFMVNTPIAPEISMVLMQISDRNLDKHKPLYEMAWEKKDEDVSVASLICHYKLRQNTEYNIRFSYYRSISDTERRQVADMLLQTCYSTLQASINEKGSKFKARYQPRVIYDMLNQAISKGLAHYMQAGQRSNMDGFSGLIYEQLKSTVARSTDAGLDGSANIDVLKKQIATEITIILNKFEYIIDEQYDIPGYPTEKISNALALNIGYGGIYNSGTIDDLRYYDAPYAGLSFPLGNKIFRSALWSNMSLSAGVLLKNFKPDEQTELSGPLVNLPVYAALGYKVFNYFRINAGVTALEQRNLASGSKTVNIHAFAGLSLEMYLWMGFNKNRK